MKKKEKKSIICFCLAAIMLWSNITVAVAKTPKCNDSLYVFNNDRTIHVTADDVPNYVGGTAWADAEYTVWPTDVFKIGITVEKNILINKRNTECYNIARDAMKITISNPKVLKIKEIKIPQNTYARKQVVLEAIGIGDCKLNIKIPKTAVSRKASFTIPIHVIVGQPRLISAKSNKKGQVTVKVDWSKAKGAEYYEVECCIANESSHKNCKSKKFKRGTDTVTLKGLKSGKTYYIYAIACQNGIGMHNQTLKKVKIK